MTKIIYAFTAFSSALYFAISVYALSNFDSLPVPSNSALSVIIAIAMGYGIMQPLHAFLIIVAHNTEKSL